MIRKTFKTLKLYCQVRMLSETSLPLKTFFLGPVRRAIWPLRFQSSSTAVKPLLKEVSLIHTENAGSCHTSGLSAWPLRMRRLSSLETAAAKPLGYVRRTFF